MSFLSSLRTWGGKRRRLLAGVVGVAVETACASIPGVNLAAGFLGRMIENATEDALDPDNNQPLPAEQLAQVNAWLEHLAGSYAGLLDRLEQLPLPASGSLDVLSCQLKQALAQSAELTAAFDSCLVEVRRQTLSLGIIERKLDEHFHAQQKVNASLEEIKDVFIRSPMMGEWASFRRVRPEAVQAVLEADAHFLAGRRDQGVAVYLRLLQQHGIGDATVAHQLGIVEFGQGKLREAAARLAQLGQSSAVRHTATNLSTLSGKGAGLGVWRSLPRGHLINYKYRVEEEVGRGGMASVYRAVLVEEFEHDAVVALKVPAPALVADAAARQRFQKEIERSRQLRHRHIVRVDGYEVFDEPHTRQRTYGMVMEYVPGKSLSRYLADRRGASKPLTLDEIRNVMGAVCAGLEYAHEHKVLHRDIKPHNVLVAKGGVIKLMDFGIARELDDSQEHLTKSGQVVGTLAYMPPEMAVPDEDNPVGVAADVYMAGVLLQELLTFKPNGKLSERADCPAEWRALIKAARDHDPAERPQSIAAFRERLVGKTAVPVTPAAPVAAPVAKVAAPTPVAQPAVTRKQEPPREMANSIGMKYVLIPAGKFKMGSPASEASRSNDEGPQHEVEITKPFYLGIYPVTQAQWQAVMGNNPSYFGSVQGMDTSDFPVEQVSWEDAQVFLKKLSELEKEAKAGRKYRLPSEAEWEYACRGGASSYQTFHFGNSLSSPQANFNGTLGRTCPVGSYPANAFGLFDMHGNVWEWCSDWFDAEYYGKSPPRDPAGPPSDSLRVTRVTRGGGWVNLGQECRSANRDGGTLGFRYSALGFRVAAVPPE